MVKPLTCFEDKFPPAFKLIVRVSKCCMSIITKPTANSTAEKIKKKNVKETRFKLSYANPTINVKAYRVIQMSSAVSRRWSEVFVWIIKVLESIKNKINKRFKSPKNKTNLEYLYTVNHLYSFFYVYISSTTQLAFITRLLTFRFIRPRFLSFIEP